jgi:hypothetical protein
MHLVTLIADNGSGLHCSSSRRKEKRVAVKEDQPAAKGEEPTRMYICRYIA